MRTLLLVGAVGCGKSTFMQRLNGLPVSYAKTQAMELIGQVVDTPGEYLDLGRYHHALRLASYDVDVVVLLQAANAGDTRFPPGFAATFNKEVVAVVTKTDLATPAEIASATAALRLAGANQVLAVDSLSGSGFETVREVLW